MYSTSFGRYLPCCPVVTQSFLEVPIGLSFSWITTYIWCFYHLMHWQYQNATNSCKHFQSDPIMYDNTIWGTENCTTPHCTALHRNTIYTIQYNTMDCNAMPCHAMLCHAMQCNAMQYNIKQYNFQYTRLQTFVLFTTKACSNLYDWLFKLITSAGLVVGLMLELLV